MPALLHTTPSLDPIAFLGGIYGNLPAFRACLADAQSAGAPGTLTALPSYADAARQTGKLAPAEGAWASIRSL